MAEGSHHWVSDCSTLNFGTNFPAGWKHTELCFRLRRDHMGERKTCSSSEGILCQITTGCYFNVTIATVFISSTVYKFLCLFFVCLFVFVLLCIIYSYIYFCLFICLFVSCSLARLLSRLCLPCLVLLARSYRIYIGYRL